ncbi:hypothetical protein I6F48_00190 [Pseudoalteromonas sp. SWYJ118]|uniref:hypothetical protein n=1 Tax=Pseudoalteromonas sp. SWYJ118 TaxID=2792062 RepID=UPI0018CC96B4|nr:hypothetical protein [Pseudoalteromonas sp. SWYJ118]MBH0073982.1 hypothetical protein [Pseudoalteromonas sp. SWYJ118]
MSKSKKRNTLIALSILLAGGLTGKLLFIGAVLASLLVLGTVWYGIQQAFYGFKSLVRF